MNTNTTSTTATNATIDLADLADLGATLDRDGGRHHTPRIARTRLAAVGLALALVGAACGSDTTTNDNDSTTDEVGLEAALVEETTPTTLADTDTNADAETDAETNTGTDTGTDGDASAPDPTVPPAPEPEPEPLPEAQPEPAAPCGEFGPFPPRPDSMPTLLADTDGDAQFDDEVTAYGAPDGWRLRVVENGVTSEAVMPAIQGFASIAGVADMGDGPVISVLDHEEGVFYDFSTADGCVDQIAGPGVDAIDDLVVAVPTPDPEPPVDPDLDLAVAGPCGVFGPVPADALIGSDDQIDINGDGELDRLVAYEHGGVWTLRQEMHGTISEVDIPGAGVHGVRVVGQADVAAFGGDEILAVVGGGAYTQEIGIFSSFEGPCLFRYQADGGGDFSLFSGASLMNGSGIVCGDEWVIQWGFQLEDDDTYSVWDAAFEETMSGFFGYMPSSDGFYEGLTADEVSDDLFDCNGLSL